MTAPAAPTPNTNDTVDPTAPAPGTEGGPTATDSAPSTDAPASNEQPENDGPTTDSPASSTPIPVDHAPVDVPDDVAAKLPVGTAVSMSADGNLVASVPTDGTVHHVSIIGREFHELVAAVESFFHKHFGG